MEIDNYYEILVRCRQFEGPVFLRFENEKFEIPHVEKQF